MAAGSLKLIRVLSMLLMAVGGASAAFAQAFTTYGGEATALSGTVAGIPVNLVGTGAIDPSGGARHSSLACYPSGLLCAVGVPDATSGSLSAQALSATVVGRGDQSYSRSSLAKLSLLVHGVLIKADYIEGEVKSICEDDDHGGRHCEQKGKSEFSQLSVGGTPVAVTGLPNQVLTVPGLLGGLITITLNEQTVNNGYLTVRALRIKAPGILPVVNATDVALGIGKTKTLCGEADECFDQKVTSGGFVIVNGAKITFAASGRHLDDWGHVVVINHGTDDKFQATEQWTTFIPDPDDPTGVRQIAEITGYGEINGSGTFPFTLQLQDNGEPGKNVDKFGLEVGEPKLTKFLVPFQKIAGGNIQFHKPKSGCVPTDPEGCPEGMGRDPLDPTGPCIACPFVDPVTGFCIFPE